jgi:hypothetical protein
MTSEQELDYLKNKVKDLEDSMTLIKSALQLRDILINQQKNKIQTLENQLWECKKENLRY